MSGFDFLVGDWDVANRQRRRWLAGCDDWDEFPATSTCRPLFGGAGNLDEITFPTKGFTGLTLRLYEPATKVWTLNWVSSRDGRLTPPVTGGFTADVGTADVGTGDLGTGDLGTGDLGTGDVGTFYGDDTHQGRDVRVRFLWSRITPVSARWEQAFSAGGGQDGEDREDWETNWVMDFTRRERGESGGGERG